MDNSQRQKFPFQQLLNASLFDYEQIRLILQKLFEIIKNDAEFYLDRGASKYTLEFILTNLSLCKEEVAEDIFMGFLKLLRDIITTVKQRNQSQIKIDKDRILEVLKTVTELKTFHKNHADILKVIVSHLLSIGSVRNLNQSSLKNISTMFQFFKEKFEADSHFADVGWVIVAKFPLHSEPFCSCVTWLHQDSSKIIENKNKKYENKMVATIIRTLNDFHAKFKPLIPAKKPKVIQEHFEKIMLNLFAICSELIRFSSLVQYKNEAIKLLSIILLEFVEREKVNIELNQGILNRELSILAGNFDEIPQSISKTFFLMGHLLYKYSNFLNVWKPQTVLDSLSELFYSRNRSIINEMFKTICIVYPRSLEYCTGIGRPAILLGDDILRYISKCRQSFDDIFSCDWGQFLWIMGRGSKFNELKKQLLIYWLLNHEFKKDLAQAVVACKVCPLVSWIIIEVDDPNIVNGAIELSTSIQNSSFSTQIATTLLYTLNDIDMFGRLISSKPAIPENETLAMRILDVLSSGICLLNDEKTLKCACNYATEVLTSLKQVRDSVEVFCRDMLVIKYLLLKIRKVGDGTAVDIIHLFKVIVLLQRRNKVPVENSIQLDVVQLLKGSDARINKALDLLRVIMSFQERKLGFLSIIYLEHSSFSMVCISIVTLFGKLENENGYLCLASCLRLNPNMANSALFCSLIEEKCNEKATSSNFSHLLMTYISTLKRIFYEGLCHLPDLEVVRSYVLRCDTLNTEKANHCLKTLKKLSTEQVSI